MSHVERLSPGEVFAFLTPSGTIKGCVHFTTVDAEGHLANVEISLPLVDGKVVDENPPRMNLPGRSVSAYWKCR